MISGRDLLVLCESRVSAWLWRCAMLLTVLPRCAVSLVILWSRAALTVLLRCAVSLLRCAVSLPILLRCPSHC